MVSQIKARASLEQLAADLKKLDEMSKPGAALYAARATVAQMEKDHESDAERAYFIAQIKALKAQAADMETTLLAKEKAFADRLREAVKAADAAEKGDHSRMKEAAAFAMMVSDTYGMALSDLRALVST